MKKIIFCSYHQRDFLFYYKISLILKKNYKIYIICFHSIDNKKNIKGIKFINFYSIVLKNKKKYCINEIYFRHEIINSDLNIEKLKNKFQKISNVMNFLLIKIKPSIVIHEIGGFVVHHAIFQICKMNKIQHLFLEPSPLKKYCLFIKNSWSLDYIKKIKKTKRTTLIIKNYIKNLKKQQYRAINKKDLHFDKNILLLISNVETIKIFFKKLKNKIFRTEVIFDNLIFFTFFFLKRLINYFFNLFYKFSKVNNDAFFALQAPYDFALTNRAQNCFDQISKLKNVIKNELVMMKEHPLYKNVYMYKRELNGKHNFRFLNPFENAIPVILKSRFVISINSKVGLEALILGKPVCCLAKNYYTGKGLAFVCKNYSDFKRFKKKIINYSPNKFFINELLYKIFNTSYYFDLFSIKPSEIKKSARSLKVAIDESL